MQSRILFALSFPSAKNDDLSSQECLLNSDELSHPMPKRRMNNIAMLVVHAIIFSLYTAIFLISIVFYGSKADGICDGLIYSPAREAVINECVTVDRPIGSRSLYVGEPRPELELAWRGVLNYTNIRIFAEDLRRINRTSIPLNDDEGGYVVTLDVYHQLHCLNTLRKQIYREYYPSRQSKAKQLEHVDHCVDILRQVFTCHGDIAIQSYTWIDNYRWPWPQFHTQHECRKWDSINQWAKDRHVASLMGPILSHPTLGTSYRGDADE